MDTSWRQAASALRRAISPTWSLLAGLGLILACGVNAHAQPSGKDKPEPAQPTAQLPTPPDSPKNSGPVLSGNLADVPEVAFAKAPAKGTPAETAHNDLAKQIDNMRAVNKIQTDAFMKELVAKRPDLAGLAMAMGPGCRMSAEQAKHFQVAVNAVRQAQFSIDFTGGFGGAPPGGFGGSFGGGSFGGTPPGFGGGGFGGNFSGHLAKPATDPADRFWDSYLLACRKQDKDPKASRAEREQVALARIAALTQMLAASPPGYRKGLVTFLSGISRVEATQAIAKLAIFSPERQVREVAIDALKVRREKDYTSILVEGLRYPWPAVAQRAASTLAKLDLQDAIPALIDALDAPDPRMPIAKEADGKPALLVRELVRVNHHRNCLLCHPPVGLFSANLGMVLTSDNKMEEIPTGPIPVPGRLMQSPLGGYAFQTTRELIVRVDATYLRQDFSVLLPVPDAAPWPTEQRFDFMVRTRKVNAGEAARFRAALRKRGAGQLSPYESAIHAALCNLTGRSAEPTAAAWRELLASR